MVQKKILVLKTEAEVSETTVCHPTHISDQVPPFKFRFLVQLNTVQLTFIFSVGG